MDHSDRDAARAVPGVLAFDRRSVERFFAAACRRRALLLTEIAQTRRRIADAEAALAADRDLDAQVLDLVLAAQTRLNEEVRTNKRRIVEVFAQAAKEAEDIATDAKRAVTEQLAMGRGSNGGVSHREPHCAASAFGPEGQPRSHRNGSAPAKHSAPAWTARF